MEIIRPFEEPQPRASLQNRGVLSYIRSAIAPVLLAGGSLMAGDMPEMNQKHPEKQEQELQDLKIRIHSLIALLNSDSFQVREKAHKDLIELMACWAEKNKKSFVFKDFVKSKSQDKHLSLEQTRRLERIHFSYNEREAVMMQTAQPIRIPEEWIKQKNPPALADVLSLLEEQRGERLYLDYYDEKWKWKNAPHGRDMAGLTYWQLIQKLTKVQNGGGVLFPAPTR